MNSVPAAPAVNLANVDIPPAVVACRTEKTPPVAPPYTIPWTLAATLPAATPVVQINWFLYVSAEAATRGILKNVAKFKGKHLRQSLL